MPSTIFSPGTVVTSEWLNGVNDAVYVNPPDSATPSTITLANFSINQATVNGRVDFINTNPTVWNTTNSRKTVDFEFICNSYFSVNPNSHLAVVCRCDTDVINTDVRGAGAIFGDLVSPSFAGDGAKYKPTSIIESWSRPQIPFQRFLWPETTGPRNKLLQDGVRYRFIVETTKQPNVAGIYIRNRVYQYNATKIAWDLLVDTGDVLDASNISDMTKSGLVFGSVYSSVVTPWSIDFSNIKVTWGPCGNVVQDNSASLSKYGADLQGDLTFLDQSRTVSFPVNTSAPSLATSLTFQSSSPNTATTLVFKPNGTNKTAGILASNDSSSTTTYQAVSFGMVNTEGILETIGYGVAGPPIGINIQGGGRIATFNANGITVLNGTRSIGQAINYGVGLTNFGGSNAVTFNTTNSVDLDGLCAVGAIGTFLGGAGATATNNNVEVATRPLYCMLSGLISDLKAKKVI